jgi:hypothetical protein
VNTQKSIEKSRPSSVATGQTPETYLGYERGERFANARDFKADTPIDYALPSVLANGEWGLGGNWQINNESSQALASGATLRINYTARDVYLVLSGQPGGVVSVSAEGTASAFGGDVNPLNGQLIIDSARLYNIVTSDGSHNGTVNIVLPAGVTAHAFTFGS